MTRQIINRKTIGAALLAAVLLILTGCVSEELSSDGEDYGPIDGDNIPVDGDDSDATDGDDVTASDLCDGVVCREPVACENDVACNPETGLCESQLSEEGSSCDDGLACNGEEVCDGNGSCVPGDAVVCDGNEHCAEASGNCECSAPYEWRDSACVAAICEQDSDCDDGLVCTGEETCENGTCQAGEAISCNQNASCNEQTGACECNYGYKSAQEECAPVPCPIPQAPTLTILPADMALPFRSDLPVEYRFSAGGQDLKSLEWTRGDFVVFDKTGKWQLEARTIGDGCFAIDSFQFTYEVKESFSPAAHDDGSSAIAMDDPRFVGWASSWVEPINYGAEIGEDWQTPELSVGPADGTNFDVVSLGRGGSITMLFDRPFGDGPGPDLAVFENAFMDTFIELAFIEVSSDGETFIRFDSGYLGENPVAAFGGHDPSLVGGLAGKFRRGFGVPFDLAALANREEVRTGQVDLSAITAVRVVDVVGDGNTRDSFGNPIYDPYPTVDSSGFDLDAIGILEH